MDVVPTVTRRGAMRAVLAAWQGELHDLGASYATSAQPTAATIVALNSIVQGDLQGNRDGARVALNRVCVAYSILGTVATGSIVRCILLWDTQTNGVAPTEAMIQETTTANAVLAAAPNFNYRGRLKVLYDKTHVVNTVSYPLFTTNFSVDLTGKQTTYVAGAGAGTVADIITGGLFWYVKADGNNTTSNSLNAALYFHP